MSRITKVEGSVRVTTESGGSFRLDVTGHGLRGNGSIHDLGPYVGRLVADELRKVLADEPAPKPAPPMVPVAPKPSVAPKPTEPAPKRAKGTHRG